MSIELIIVLGLVFVAVCIGLGIYFVTPSWKAGGSRSDLGVALMTGAVVSVAVLGLQIANELRQNDVEKRRQLLAMIATSPRLDGIELSGEDLAGVHLGSKFFAEAIFVDADLRRANLSKSHFENAVFDGADLRGANLRSADFQGAKLPRADLSGARVHSTCLREADLRGANVAAREFSETDIWFAEIDSRTRGWPDDTGWPKPECTQDLCVLTERAYIREGACDG